MAIPLPRKTAKSERTRKSIIASYLALLDEIDFDKVSVSRICKEAGIVRSTFYVYFSDVYELIQEVEDSTLEALGHADDQTDAAMEHDANRARTDWGFPLPPPYSLGRWYEICEQEGLVLQAMLGPHGDPYFEERFKRALAAHLRRTMDTDGMPRDTLREAFVDALLGANLSLIKSWLLDGTSQLTPQKIVTIVNSIRVGGNTIGHFAAAQGAESWM